MWDDQTIMMLLEGTRDTLYMTLVSTFFGYVLGLPLLEDFSHYVFDVPYTAIQEALQRKDIMSHKRKACAD